MLELDLNVRHARGLLYRGYNTRIQARLGSVDRRLNNAIPITRLAERIFELAPRIIATLTRAEVVDESGASILLLENLRGRPAETFAQNPAVPAAGRPTEELFYSDGILFEPPKNLNDYPESIETLKTEPFSFSLETGFERYAGSNKILHSVKNKQTENIRGVMESFEVGELLRMFPARLTRLRIGFEQYRPAWLGSVLGSSVTIHRRLYLEIGSAELSVLAEQTSGAARGELPFTEDGLFPALDSSLAEFNLFSGLSSQIRARL